MSNRLISTIFNIGVMAVTTATAAWLTMNGHTLLLGGLLMALGNVLAAVVFGFRLAEGSGPERLSIWAGPYGSTRRIASSSQRL